MRLFVSWSSAQLRIITSLVAAGLLCLTLAGCAWASRARSEAIFNGRDLSGWIVMHGGEWTVEDGVLVGRNGRDWTIDPALSGSWLRTKRAYGDFVLEFDYAVQGNSGVFLRAGMERNPAFTGYEMQILSDQGRAPSKSSAGGIYDVVAASRNMSRPAGEWNHVMIRCEGNRVQITWNGEKVVDYAEANRSRRGYIGLQNHDERSVVKFRNLRVTEL